MEMWTPDRSPMSPPTTSKDIPSATSSPASAAGAQPFDAQAFGRIVVQFGLEAVLASLSPSRASRAGLTTSGTSGPTGNGSSASAALQLSLESRLRRQLNGSDLCEVIWKRWATPWGQCLFKPRARVRTTFETGSGLWPTAVANDDNKSVEAHLRMKANMPGGPRTAITSLQVMVKSTWVSPTAEDGRRGNKPPRPWDTGIPLSQQVATWSTPRASPNENRTTKATPSQMEGKHGQYLAVQAITSNGSSERTEKPGALNPEFVCWLMGYPPEWLNCAPSEMPSTRGQRRNLSRQ